jgi:hypothetical protein
MRSKKSLDVENFKRTVMLDILFGTVIPQLPSMFDDPSRWDSLIINRRRPHTYRVFTLLGKLRVCLHKFNACDRHEAFPHPHPWPGAFLVLQGAYRMTLGLSKDRTTKPEPLTEFRLTAGSAYEITNPLLWHSVIPECDTYTIMVNDDAWPAEVVHEDVRRTGGKEWERLSESELIQHLVTFRTLLVSSRY